mmetsp:Transcript_2890/g.8451  ORF Transcript_2890/g.8451 Transcript_2890/m.8451 type:complete len:298 (+) Transcript_2890:123-1016(+)
MDSVHAGVSCLGSPVIWDGGESLWRDCQDSCWRRGSRWYLAATLRATRLRSSTIEVLGKQRSSSASGASWPGEASPGRPLRCTMRRSRLPALLPVRGSRASRSSHCTRHLSTDTGTSRMSVAAVPVSAARWSLAKVGATTSSRARLVRMATRSSGSRKCSSYASAPRLWRRRRPRKAGMPFIPLAPSPVSHSSACPTSSLRASCSEPCWMKGLSLKSPPMTRGRRWRPSSTPARGFPSRDALVASSPSTALLNRSSPPDTGAATAPTRPLPTPLTKPVRPRDWAPSRGLDTRPVMPR